ncbi:IMAP FAMILY MEMBER 1 putative-RELATED [Salix koriyanagi]|uniref:IMAP FAMILY MEMBER 1 putative-RELATED n=1 Tax=Salix koriyanagi TaxID=2511006 RepID=A0A9Q0PMB2_9ROSI|nr:IMAP FAMILY MEMBER 1 putative-RELATED [Salix koriyanagi]
MENDGGAVIKDFILSIPESVSRIWQGARQQASQQLPRPTMNEEEELANMSRAKLEMEWQKVLISMCCTSVLEIALHFHQITHPRLDSLHLACILLAIVFSCLFVSHSINPTKFPRTTNVLGKVAAFLASTVFFIIISIPFPPGVKWATWIIYAITLLAIAICNFCY